MFLKNVTDFFKTVTFRLTLWYSILFGISSLIVFIFIYFFLSSRLKKQTDLELLSKAREFQALYREQGLNALRSEFQRESNSRGIKRVFFSLITPKGKILISSNMKAWKIKKSYIIKTNFINKPIFKTILIRGYKHYRTRLIFIPMHDDNVLICGIRMMGTDIIKKELRETFCIAITFILIFGGLTGYIISKKAMAGVQRVTSTALHIQKGDDLSRRVPLGKEGLEIDHLVKAFNHMLDKIEILISNIKEVSDNIAHDLKSPVTKIRGFAETTLLCSSDIEDFKEMTAKVIGECDRLIEMINTMLEITKTEAGVLELKKQRLNINQLIEDAIDLFSPLADDKNLNIECHIPHDLIFIYADKSKLQRAIANILDNAIKYTPVGGKVKIFLNFNELLKLVNIEIEDTGIGITKNDLPHIFDRFYRAEYSRTSPGSGLGLSLAKAIVEAHCGNIEVISSPNRGSKFIIVLPVKE